MFIMLNMSAMILIIATLMINLSSMISKKLNNREKSSPFECGFDPKSSSRMPFSLRFFLFTIMFLIFDVEIALLIPMIHTYQESSPTQWILTIILFIMILIIGLIHEWNQGSLEWSK